MMKINTLTSHFVVLLFIVLSPVTAFSELTLETGENPGELYFLWQDTLTSPGARSHRLSEMRAFIFGYSKALIQKLEVLEVRELDTDQQLRFNYVVPRKSPKEKMLRDVVWYYPNPIPSGGRVRVQIRGRMEAPKVYHSEPNKVEINYESREGTFVILPLGYALTYGNNPVIVYEKNARTVCSFKNSPLSLIAKSIDSLAATKKPPAISRNVLAAPSISKIQMEVDAVENPEILASSKQRLRGATPVWYVSADENAISDASILQPKETLIWKVNNIIINGVDDFHYITEHSEIGSDLELALAKADEKGRVRSTATVKIRVISVDK